MDLTAIEELQAHARTPEGQEELGKIMKSLTYTGVIVKKSKSSFTIQDKDLSKAPITVWPPSNKKAPCHCFNKGDLVSYNRATNDFELIAIAGSH